MTKKLLMGSVATLFAISPVFADDTQFAAQCGSTALSLGMSDKQVLKACGKPSDQYSRQRGGHTYKKLEYKVPGSNDNELELKFSDMRSKGELQLYEIELDQEQEQYNPYKQ